MKIAVRESRDHAAQRVMSTLSSTGVSAVLFGSHGDFLHAVGRKSFDLVIIGGAPEDDGAGLVHTLRKQLGVSTPVLRLIDDATEKDIADALLGGADDCMPYPVRVLEFAARVTALTRRGKGAVAKERERIEVGSLVVDRKNRLIFRENEPVPMTPKTYNLAVLLLSNVGQLMSRNEMLHAVWGTAKKGSTRTLDTHVSRLRLSLGLLPQYGWQLQSVYQYGYRLDRLDYMDRMEQVAA